MTIDKPGSKKSNRFQDSKKNSFAQLMVIRSDQCVCVFNMSMSTITGNEGKGQEESVGC